MDAGSMGAKRAAKSRQGAGLQAIPSVNDLLLRPRLVDFAKNAGHDLVVRAVRGVLDELRREAKNGSPEFAGKIDPQNIENRVAESLEADLTSSLRPVINATGVVLHTNLGRAPLSIQAATRIMETATRYTNLEYDVAAGKRGQRDVHTARHLAELLGAESAILVNNNAAAVFLVLNTLAKGFEVLVSRGELIEIGDGFRIPDIMRESGAVLCEVGTTNRTRIRDYEEAIGRKTRLLLRVHPSNFQISGFAARPSLSELAALSRRAKLPLFEDLGSGCVADL